MEHLYNRCEILARHLYGKSSQKRHIFSEDDPFQLKLFSESSIIPGEQQSSSIIVPAHKRQLTKPTIADDQETPKFSDSLRRVVKEILPESTACSCCGEEMKQISEKVTELLAQEPVSYYVKVIKRQSLAAKDASRRLYRLKTTFNNSARYNPYLIPYSGW